MLLITVATENEIKPLSKFLASVDGVDVFVMGMGPVAAAVSLSKFMSCRERKIDAVVNIGVAGAYEAAGIKLLDVCLAQQEFLGDFGICLQDEILDFDPITLKPYPPLVFDSEPVKRFENILHSRGIEFKKVNFVTVNCCSGTAKRGQFLQEKYGAGCENMEGASVAMVCQEYAVPCIEMRCVSNMVENRKKSSWRLLEATVKICGIIESVLPDYINGGNTYVDGV